MICLCFCIAKYLENVNIFSYVVLLWFLESLEGGAANTSTDEQLPRIHWALLPSPL